MNINLLIKRLSKFAFLCFLVALGTTNTKAQLSPSSQSNIVVPNTLSGCARDTILLRVTNLTGPSCVPSGSSSDITYQVTIPGGVEITYLTGSLFSKTAGVSPSFVGYSSNVLTFTVPAPSLGYTTTVGFVVAATCNVTAVTPLPEFSITANYPTGFTPVSETWKSAKMNVGLGQLTLRGHCAWHSPSFNSSACHQKEYTQVVGFGANLGDYVDIENTGFGSITDIEYNIVVDDSLYWFYNATQSGASANVPINTNQFQYFYSWNAPAYSSCSNCDKWLGTGVGGGSGYTADVTVSTYGGKRWYKFNIRPQTLGGNGQFDPGEIMRFPIYLRAPKTCVRDQKILRWVTYKCANGTGACQKSDTFTTNFKISAGVPIISVQNKQVQTWDGCQNKTASFTFVNSGTPISGFPEVSTAYDLELKVAIGGKMDIKNLTFAGVTTVPTIETFPGVANNITWKIKDQLTFDPDGPGGLTDLDGDGFYDELRPGDSIKVSFTYSVPCDGVACGADLYYNITGVSAFTDYCRKLNGTGSVPIYEFGFKQIAPTAQVTPLPDFGTMGLRALQTRTGTFNLNYKSININTSGATAKLRINYSKTMMVVEPISFLGVSRTLSAFTAIGTGDVTPTTSTAAGYADTGSYAGPVGKRYDNDSALEYTLTLAEIATLLDGTSDQLSYSLTHIACDSFQNQRNTDNFQIIFTMGTTCSPPPPPCGLDLVCKKSFSYNVSEGCGNFPCYRAKDTLFRYGRTGFTNENLPLHRLLPQLEQAKCILEIHL